MKLVVSTLLLFVWQLTIGQEQFQGIYKFKPGVSTTSIIAEIETELKTKTESVDNPSTFVRKKLTPAGRLKPYIFQLENRNARPESKQFGPEYIHKSPFHTSHKAYFISRLAVNEIELNSVYLYFRNDRLVKVECERTDVLMKAMTAKYGVPIKETDIDTVKCIYKLTGREVDELGYTNTLTWKSGEIIAQGIENLYFDTNCQKNYISLFSFEDQALFSLYLEEELAAEKILRQKLAKGEEERMKKNLSDF